ncbi:hypothetical protein COHA_010683 [Chlorella ohadii]|uniref:Secondary thiamine-phosphate synthase enzyme n=1 Tax=Chlorella ohadii TaxID=2649997 RepID=A0AAD5DJD5_9CHLO|nr:hypothetical protein COHA_010683 [Chlorella ohadii]
MRAVAASTPAASSCFTTRRPAARRLAVAVRAAPATTAAAAAPAVFHYTELQLETKPGIHIVDITPQIRAEVERLGVQEGFVNVLSRHTTTAVTINECEPRLLDDIRQAPPNWPGGWEAWAAQEPENAHSHLLSMVLGNSETVPVTGGKLALGQWQSVMLVELDGARKRTVGVQVVGTQQAAGSS